MYVTTGISRMHRNVASQESNFNREVSVINCTTCQGEAKLSEGKENQTLAVRRPLVTFRKQFSQRSGEKLLGCTWIGRWIVTGRSDCRLYFRDGWWGKKTRYTPSISVNNSSQNTFLFVQNFCQFSIGSPLDQNIITGYMEI